MAIPDEQRYPTNNNVEYIIVFLGLKVNKTDNSHMFSSSRNAPVTFVENSQLKIVGCLNYKL